MESYKKRLHKTTGKPRKIAEDYEKLRKGIKKKKKKLRRTTRNHVKLTQLETT